MGREGECARWRDSSPSNLTGELNYFRAKRDQKLKRRSKNLSDLRRVGGRDVRSLRGGCAAFPQSSYTAHQHWSRWCPYGKEVSGKAGVWLFSEGTYTRSHSPVRSAVHKPNFNTHLARKSSTAPFLAAVRRQVWRSCRVRLPSLGAWCLLLREADEYTSIEECCTLVQQSRPEVYCCCTLRLLFYRLFHQREGQERRGRCFA